MTVPDLRTARLLLRGLRESDEEAVVDVFAAPEMSEFYDFSEAAVRRMVHARVNARNPPGMGHWVVEHEGAVIALAHLRPSKELPGGLIEIGWYLSREHWGHGYAAEAATRLLSHGLTDLGTPAVWAVVHEANHPSLKLAARLGFLDVGGGAHYGGGPHRVHVALPPAARSRTAT
jgi:RimJ/RimL family protein N-acetyltransferase